ncbi:hypothetical protein [Bradyrhizobium lablabi]|uniref:hypothetical protein n=1 Tax=Bradyrhizobium lablabi TaxID=722472 RepID=UPI001BA6D6F8|nr:hypothetical protein [Bradyrhizobium lablabi]MBR0696171.1 hypothetical protein [Bradyrhizobium lablabi]
MLKSSCSLKVMVACLAIVGAYLPVALWMGSGYTPDPRPPGAVVELIVRAAPDGGFAYKTMTYLLGDYVDADAKQQGSPILLYEGTTPLEFPRSSRADVQNAGQGRFNFLNVYEDTEWRTAKYIVFSTSDNSDPRTNGRRYWAVLPKGVKR